MKKLKKMLFLLVGAMIISFTTVPVQAQAKTPTNYSVARVSTRDFQKIGYCNSNGVNFRKSSDLSVVIGVMSNRHTLYINPNEKKTYNGETYIHCYSISYNTDGYVCSRYVTISGNLK